MRIVNAAKCIKSVLVGDFSFSYQGMRLGDLSGNAFKVVLREVTACDADINAALVSLQSTGAINYYGLQRFGTKKGHTHVTGRLMMASKWKEVRPFN